MRHSFPDPALVKLYQGHTNVGPWYAGIVTSQSNNADGMLPNVTLLIPSRRDNICLENVRHWSDQQLKDPRVSVNTKWVWDYVQFPQGNPQADEPAPRVKTKV